VREFYTELCVSEKFSLAVMGDLLGFQKLNFLCGKTLCVGHAVYLTIVGVCTAGNYAQMWTTKLHIFLFLVLGSFVP
jgi:hypothetical protein